MIRQLKTNDYYKYLGILYFTIALFAIYFTTDLYWWPEGGPGVGYDWVQFPTGLVLLSPLFIIWGLIYFKIQTIEKAPSLLEEQRMSFRKKELMISFLTYLLFMTVSVSSSHILSTLRLRDDTLQNPIFFPFLMLFFAFTVLSGLVLFFVDRFSRIPMDIKKLGITVKIALLLIPLVQVCVALFSVSFTRNQFQVFIFGDGFIDVLSIFSTTVLPIFLGITGVGLAFTDLLPLFFPFLIFCTSLFFLELLIIIFHPK